MKSIVLAMTLVFSTTIFAQTPATVAVTKLLSAGTYEGKDGSTKCIVDVSTKTDSVSIAIKNVDIAKYFTIIDSANNYNVNEDTGEIGASQNFKFPKTDGVRVLAIKANDLNEVEFYISDIFLDHAGNDISSYASCTVTL